MALEPQKATIRSQTRWRFRESALLTPRPRVARRCLDYMGDLSADAVVHVAHGRESVALRDSAAEDGPMTREGVQIRVP